jgi:hypothetical protein
MSLLAGKMIGVYYNWNNPARSTLGYSPGSSWCSHLLPSWRASLLTKVTVGRRIKRSAANAASMANALNQPNRRSDGRSEHRYHLTASEHDRGQNQRRANKHGCPFDGDGRVLVRSLLVPQPVKECMVALRPNPKETVSATTLANCRPCACRKSNPDILMV